MNILNNSNTGAPASHGDKIKWGLYGSSAVFTMEDIYNNFIHNYLSYPTTRGYMKYFSDFNGRVMSDRALTYSRLSRNVKWAGNIGTGLMVFQAGYNYLKFKDRTLLNYMDGSVGLLGLGNSTLLQFTSYGTPVVGQFVAAYSISRLYYDCVVVPNIGQVKNNINEGNNPLQGVYVPALGDYYYPTVWGF